LIFKKHSDKKRSLFQATKLTPKIEEPDWRLGNIDSIFECTMLPRFPFEVQFFLGQNDGI